MSQRLTDHDAWQSRRIVARFGAAVVADALNQLVARTRTLVRTRLAETFDYGTHRFTDAIEWVNIRAGEFVAYWAVISVFGYYYEVIARFAFNSPTNWLHESMFLMYGMQYMIAGAYAYQCDQHVRVDGHLVPAARPLLQRRRELPGKVLRHVVDRLAPVAARQGGSHFTGAARKRRRDARVGGRRPAQTARA